MRTLMMGMLFCLVSGDDNVNNVAGFVGGDVLLPCNCPNRNPAMEFRWQAEDNESVLVKHTGNTSNFTDKYKDRAELFLSDDSSNCSLLLKNIRLEDDGKYKCSFKYGRRHDYSYVNLTVSLGHAGIVGGRFGTRPVPTEPTSPDNIRTLCRLMPVVLVAVLSLFLFFLYKRKVSGQLNAGEEERELRIPV